MAMNPMQRKANNYLIIGVLVTLLITGTIIGVLVMKILNITEERKAEKNALKNVYVTISTIKSGETVDMSLLKIASVPSDVVPETMIGISDITENTIAKIDITAGSIVSKEMITETNEKVTNDLRKQEYNMLELPSQLQSGEYVDVRLRLPNGVEYIVVSKKKVELPIVNGIDSANTIWLKMNEAEIQVMSNAIVEAYIMGASKLYVTRYVEPGYQAQAIPTYVPSGKVQEAIYLNPNIEQTAKAALISRYNSTSSIRNNTINEALSPYQETRLESVETKTQEEINKSAQERQKYLESLGAY